MKRLITIFFTGAFLFACDDNRIYEENIDLDNRIWMVDQKPEFEFSVTDTTESYNIYCNVRNSLDYPYSRLFLTYYLQDSIGKVDKQKLVSRMIFDPTTGKPEGTSGLGDIYDHRFLIVKDHKFRYRGKHRIKLEQFMRKDTLPGILAVGVRVERTAAK
jgi:gliding motility-associated lipoprotein GldH